MEKQIILNKIKNNNIDLRDEYLEHLIKQFNKATNSKKIDITSPLFRSEFANWLNEREIIGDLYISLLEYMNLEHDTMEIAEIGKGFVDSIALKNNETTLITPYTHGIDKKQGNIIIKGNIEVVDDDSNGLLLEKEVPFIKGFMTQNPYKTKSLSTFEEIHNADSHRIIVGVYGSTYDKDKEKKIEMLRKFKTKLIRNYQEEYVKVQDKYCYVIATKDLIRIKRRTK